MFMVEQIISLLPCYLIQLVRVRARAIHETSYTVLSGSKYRSSSRGLFSWLLVQRVTLHHLRLLQQRDQSSEEIKSNIATIQNI